MHMSLCQNVFSVYMKTPQ